MAPHAEQYKVENKKWDELLNHARMWRNIIKRGMRTTLHHFCVFKDSAGCEHILALGGSGQSPQQTVFSAALRKYSDTPHPSPLVLTPFLEASAAKGPPPAEVAALCERQRTALASGILSYYYDAFNDALLYTDSSNLYVMQGKVTRRVGSEVEGFPMNASLCARDSSLVAFVVSGSLYIDRLGSTIFAAYSSKDVTHGCSSFISQEELDRYTGLWWSPGQEKALLYEVVDQKLVADIQFACPGRPPSPPMKYPLAGTPNAVSSLRLAVFNGQSVTDYQLSVDLKSLYPWHEYIARLGWLPDGSAVWATLLSRLQDRLALILIPRELFCEHGSRTVSQTVCLLQDRSRSWFNPDNLTKFLWPNERSISFFHSGVKDDHIHLMLYRVVFDESFAVQLRSEMVVTSGAWSVSRACELYVDAKRKHVYFVANKHHPADSNLYVTTYERFSEPRILTEKGLSCKFDRIGDDVVELDPEVGFVCWESSLRVPPRCSFYRIVHAGDGSDSLPDSFLQHIIQLPGSNLTNEQPLLAFDDTLPSEYPDLIEYYSSNSGQMHYGLLLRPMGAVTGVRYPVVQVVYGGPGVQFVKNVWTLWINFQKFTSMGYAVVIVDGRGSANRGISFESAIKYKLGTVEVEDQVEGLREIAKQAGGLLDLSRVAIMGWSYGGYMSLLCLAKYSDVYRAAIAGGAVTCWQLYDTAYTERYLGLPTDPVYKYASVIAYVHQLPSEADRLLIVHGFIDDNVHFSHTERLIEALIAAGKPYSLQIFPSERHGMRSPDAHEHYDAAVLAFLKKALSQPLVN